MCFPCQSGRWQPQPWYPKGSEAGAQSHQPQAAGDTAVSTKLREQVVHRLPTTVSSLGGTCPSSFQIHDNAPLHSCDQASTAHPRAGAPPPPPSIITQGPTVQRSDSPEHAPFSLTGMCAALLNGTLAWDNRPLPVTSEDATKFPPLCSWLLLPVARLPRWLLKTVSLAGKTGFHLQPVIVMRPQPPLCPLRPEHTEDCSQCLLCFELLPASN